MNDHPSKAKWGGSPDGDLLGARAEQGDEVPDCCSLGRPFAEKAVPGRFAARRSPAKINWSLRVLRKRPDGYHDLESLVSPVTLYDELVFRPRPEAGIVLTCDRPAVPLDDRNLIVRSARCLAERAGLVVGLECELAKRIPIGGGLGGGSSNAAATLIALNELWGLHWSLEALSEVAAQVGSDVPLFLPGGSVIMRGRGEQVEPVPVDFGGWIVLLLPPFSISTAAVYALCVPETNRALPVEPGMGLDAIGWMERTFNTLEPAAQKVCPALQPLMQRARESARRPVRMSGSGSSLFTAFDTAAEAETFAHDAARRLELETCVVQVRH